MLQPGTVLAVRTQEPIDVERTVALVNQYNATLQVEDPSQDWTKAPDRYLRMGERYRHVPLKKPFMIDINVLNVHPSNQNGFATAQPTGVEVVQLWRAASSQSARYRWCERGIWLLAGYARL